MKLIYIFMLLAVIFASCNDDKQKRLLLTFEFDNKSAKQELVQRFKELQLNEFTELEAVGAYEWAFYFDGTFSKHGIQNIFRDEDAYQLAPLTYEGDLSYFLPELIQKGILIDYNASYKRSPFHKDHIEEVEEAVAHWTAEVGPLASYSLHIDRQEDYGGNMNLIVVEKSNVVSMSQYVNRFIFELEVYEYKGEYDSVEKLMFEFKEPGATILKDLTTESEGKHLAFISKGEVLSTPMVNIPIAEGNVEISGGSLVKVFVNKVFLKDVPGAKLVKMEWIQI